MDEQTFDQPAGAGASPAPDRDGPDVDRSVDGGRPGGRGVDSAVMGADRTRGAVVAWDDPTHSDDELAEALIKVSCVEAAVRLELVRLVARLAVRGVWHHDGQTGMANWVTLHLGVSRRTARQIAQVAQVINDLPALADAFGHGRLCWDQLVALCHLAAPETDAAWAVDGPGTSPEDLTAMVRARQIRDRHARDAIERRGLVFRPDGPGATAIRGCLPTDDAARVRVALDRIREQEAQRDPDTGRRPTRAQQRADALASLAGRSLAADTHPDRATVVLHADVALLTGENPDGHAATPDGTPLAAETVRRHCCDGRIEWAIQGPDGVDLGIGRASRIWPPWLSRLIRCRDGDRCRFPGCGVPIHQIHHIRHWIPTGETTSRNGVGLCYHHHRLVHEGGWTARGDGDRNVEFTSPTGTHLISRPRRLQPTTRHRLQGILPHLAEDQP